MAEKKAGGTASQDSIITTDSDSTPKQGTDLQFAPHVLSDSHGEYLDITCGTIEGRLYMSPLKDYNGSQLGSVKCISFKGSRITPGTFEQKAGRQSTRKWKNLIYHNGKPLQLVLPLLGLDKPDKQDKSREQSPASNDCNSHSTVSSLVNPVLAFAKAYRLKGDTVSLSKALSAKFSAGHLEEALKCLWASCHSDFVRVGFTYHARRSTDPVQLFSTIFKDLISAMDKLDVGGCLPSIFCEATDLLSLPSLELDPPASQVESNTTAVESLTEAVTELQSSVKLLHCSDFSSSIASLQQLVKTAEELKEELTSSVATVKSSTTSLSSVIAGSAFPKGNGRQPPLNSKAQVKPSPDRRCNLILFGLPEKKSLADEKSCIDEVLKFVAGKPILWNDAFRLGRRKTSDDLASLDVRPRPLLVKVNSVWDRRLLSAKTKLREYDKARIFHSYK